MSQIFDTHEFVKELVSVGLPENQAEVIAKTQLDILNWNISQYQEISLIRYEHGLTQAETREDVEAFRAKAEKDAEAFKAKTKKDSDALRAKTKKYIIEMLKTEAEKNSSTKS